MLRCGAKSLDNPSVCLFLHIHAYNDNVHLVLLGANIGRAMTPGVVTGLTHLQAVNNLSDGQPEIVQLRFYALLSNIHQPGVKQGM